MTNKKVIINFDTKSILDLEYTLLLNTTTHKTINNANKVLKLSIVRLSSTSSIQICSPSAYSNKNITTKFKLLSSVVIPKINSDSAS